MYITDLSDSMQGRTLEVRKTLHTAHMALSFSLSFLSHQFSFIPFDCFFLIVSIKQNCMKVQKLLQADAFGPPDSATIASYEERCCELFPLATAFKMHAKKLSSTSSSDQNCGLPIAQVKETAAKNISASTTGGGAVVLKETSLSSTAMSDLSGDINDIPVTVPGASTSVATLIEKIALASINKDAPPV